MANEKSAVDFAAEQEAALATGGSTALEDMLFADPRNPGEPGDDADGDGQGNEDQQAGNEDQDANEGTAQADAENAKAADAAGKEAAKSDAKAGEGEEGAGKAGTGSEDEPTGVQLPSGKIIPYAELTTARQRAAAAEGQNAALQTELTELRAKVDALALKQGTERNPNAAADDQDPLAGLDPDDFPEPLVKAVKAAADAAKAATERAERAEQQVQNLVQQSERTTNDERQQLIDQNDDLRLWQSKKGGLWTDAVAKDAELRADPQWANKPTADRFAEVARRVREDNGMLPVAAAAGGSSQNADAGKSGKSSGNGSTHTGAGNRAGAAQAPPITSLSDIPGGASPNADQREAWDSASTAAIAAQFEGMSAAQIDDMLMRHG